MTYEAAIAIDPKCMDAYLALAEAYIGLGDYDSAVAILEKGYAQTESEEILQMLNKYKNGEETAETVVVEDVDLEWTLDNGAVLSRCKESKEDYFIYYELGNRSVTVRVINSMIHGFILT